MDLNTPGTAGREALAAIKEDDALKLYPEAVFSTPAAPRDLAAGANAYQLKPVRYPDHLQLVIDPLTRWPGRVALPHPTGTRS